MYKCSSSYHIQDLKTIGYPDSWIHCAHVLGSSGLHRSCHAMQCNAMRSTPHAIHHGFLGMPENRSRIKEKPCSAAVYASPLASRNPQTTTCKFDKLHEFSTNIRSRLLSWPHFGDLLNSALYKTILITGQKGEIGVTRGRH